MSTVMFDAPESTALKVFSEPEGEAPNGEAAAETAVTEQSQTAEKSTDPEPATDSTEDSTPVATQTVTAAANNDSPSTAPPVVSEVSVRSIFEDLLDQIGNAEQEIRRKESHVEMLKEQIKEAKASFEQSVIRLRELCSKRDSVGFSSPAKGKPETPGTNPENHSGIEGQSATAAATESTSQDEEYASWRDLPMTDLLKEPIKGLGPKKSEALVALCPTLGAFEDLRGQASRETKEFHELLPDRFGIDTASALEERFLNWIGTFKTGGLIKSTETEAAAIVRRSSEINTGSDNCLDFKHPEGKQWHDSGWNAYGRQIKLEECPYVPGPEQDDWIRGWLGHQLMARYDEKQIELQGDAAATDQPTQQPPTEAPKLSIMDQASSLDDL